MRRLLLVLLVGILATWVVPAWAQEIEATPEATPEPPQTSVYVTTQDYVILRQGPGQGFQRLEIVPPATTLPAIGRTTDAHWIQVYREGQMGWIASRLLIWSGDMLSLPADGINPVSYIRRRGVTITVSKEMFIYDQQYFAPGERIDFPAETARVELTGRLGSGDNFWLQFWYVDRYYWMGAWNLHLNVPGTFFDTVPDASYVYPYGRLFGKVYDGYNSSRDVYFAIGRIWINLASGQSISCDANPEAITDIEFAQSDLDREAIFVPAVRALELAIERTNSAISRLNDACALTGSDRFLTTDMVDDALNDLSEAGRNFDLVNILLSPVSNRDPALGG
jgi:hypothetical protein